MTPTRRAVLGTLTAASYVRTLGANDYGLIGKQHATLFIREGRWMAHAAGKGQRENNFTLADWQLWRTHSSVQRRHFRTDPFRTCRRPLPQGIEASSGDSTQHAGVRAPQLQLRNCFMVQTGAQQRRLNTYFNARFTLETITRDPLKVPVFTENDWASFPRRLTFAGEKLGMRRSTPA